MTGINMNEVLNLYMLFQAAYRTCRSYVKRKYFSCFQENVNVNINYKT